MLNRIDLYRDWKYLNKKVVEKVSWNKWGFCQYFLQGVTIVNLQRSARTVAMEEAELNTEKFNVSVYIKRPTIKALSTNESLWNFAPDYIILTIKICIVKVYWIHSNSSAVLFVQWVSPLFFSKNVIDIYFCIILDFAKLLGCLKNFDFLHIVLSIIPLNLPASTPLQLRIKLSELFFFLSTNGTTCINFF